MSDAIDSLKQIKGVGDVLAGRLIAAGFDSASRLATASEEQLSSVKGLRPGAIPGIQAQARALAEAAGNSPEDTSLAGILEDTERLRVGVVALVSKLGDQYNEDEDGKATRQLRKEISRVLATLERVEACLAEQLRRLGKKLAKADARLAGLGESDLYALTEGLRHTRKTIDKVIRS